MSSENEHKKMKAAKFGNFFFTAHFENATSPSFG